MGVYKNEMLRVYLDQNKWIDLARAEHGRPGGTQFVEALIMAKYAAEHSHASFPLSATHYMETLKRRDAASRHRLAYLMHDLSKFHTIASPSTVLPSELDFALKERFGKPEDPRPMRVFGVGVGHAFGYEGFTYRIPEEINVTPEKRYLIEKWAKDFIERGLLAGPGPDKPVIGMIENDYYRAFGERYAAGERQLAKGIVQHSASKAQIRDWVAASEYFDILEVLNEALDYAGITRGESVAFESRDGLMDFLMALPSRAVVWEFRRLLHTNPQTRWQPNDLHDVGALGIAVAYCDVVVTEKRWCRLAEQASLAERFRTKVISDLRELPELLLQA